MEEQAYVWFLLGLKPGENSLVVFNMGRSIQNPELLTEHEPRALAVLKKDLPESKDTEGFKLHACRLAVGDDRPSQLYKERKRWRDEFRRFLAKCDLTLVEQNEMIETFAEETINLIRDGGDGEARIRPLSQSMWGKKISSKVK